MNDITFQYYLIGILAVANNIPAIAPYLILSHNLDKKTRNKICGIITTTSFLVMASAFFFGTSILGFFGISISSFQIAGGILLCSTGVGMLNSKQKEERTDKKIDQTDVDYSKVVSTSIVPIAIPLTTGAGTMSTITVFAEAAHKTSTNIQLGLAILCMTIIIYISFYFVNNFVKFLGNVGLSVMTKIMGLFTLAIGVQFISEGAKTMLKTVLTTVS